MGQKEWWGRGHLNRVFFLFLHKIEILFFIQGEDNYQKITMSSNTNTNEGKRRSEEQKQKWWEERGAYWDDVSKTDIQKAGEHEIVELKKEILRLKAENEWFRNKAEERAAENFELTEENEELEYKNRELQEAATDLYDEVLLTKKEIAALKEEG